MKKPRQAEAKITRLENGSFTLYFELAGRTVRAAFAETLEDAKRLRDEFFKEVDEFMRGE